MKVKAAVLTLTVNVDMGTLAPELELGVDLEESFSFLANDRDVLARWLHAAANSVEASTGPIVPDEDD